MQRVTSMNRVAIGASAIFRGAGLSPKRPKTGISVGLLAVSLCLTAPAGWAAQCSLGVQGLQFGSYDVFAGQSLESTGNIVVTCDSSVPYVISLSPGSGSYASRTMSYGVHKLNYNLYTDATRTIIWGDGTGGTATLSAVWTTTANHAVYGRVPAAQNAHVGSYSDSITVTINF